VHFVREPEVQPHGKVAVFADLYGNLWDLIQPAQGKPPMNVRFATAEDAPTIASVHVDAWRQAYAGVLPQATLDGLSLDARTRMWSQAIAGTRGRVLVADEGGDIMGLAAYGPCRDAGASPTEHELWAIYVAPRRWRGGAGRALWAAARQAMVSAHATDITVWVLAENQPARDFYESVGLQLAPESAQRAVTVGDTAVHEVRYVMHVANVASYDYP
jgi:GNAT superfamily N-acetyltransferase